MNSQTNLNIFHIFKNVSTVITNRLVPLAVQAMLLVGQSTNLMVPCRAQTIFFYYISEVSEETMTAYTQHLHPQSGQSFLFIYFIRSEETLSLQDSKNPPLFKIILQTLVLISKTQQPLRAILIYKEVMY